VSASADVSAEVSAEVSEDMLLDIPDELVPVEPTSSESFDVLMELLVSTSAPTFATPASMPMPVLAPVFNEVSAKAGTEIAVVSSVRANSRFMVVSFFIVY
jgi:hypothetical protein